MRIRFDTDEHGKFLNALAPTIVAIAREVFGVRDPEGEPLPSLREEQGWRSMGEAFRREDQGWKRAVLHVAAHPIGFKEGIEQELKIAVKEFWQMDAATRADYICHADLIRRRFGIDILTATDASPHAPHGDPVAPVPFAPEHSCGDPGCPGYSPDPHARNTHRVRRTAEPATIDAERDGDLVALLVKLMAPLFLRRASSAAPAAAGVPPAADGFAGETTAK